MAEDRMLSDEILLGLIKANSGGGGGGTPNYNDLSNKPQIGGVTLSGNKSASDLGLVAAVDGKGLSTNDYTNADKAIVGGVTAALAGKQNALTAGDYIAFDSNEISVNRDLVPHQTSYRIKGTGRDTMNITKYIDGVQENSTDYVYSQGTTRTIDDAFTINDTYSSAGYIWQFVWLKDSTTHDKDYIVEYRSYEGAFDFTEVFNDEDLGGYKLVIKSEMDTALATKADLTDLAPAFSASTAYTVGQYVSYDGNIYKCTSAHSAGAWAAGDFTLVAVGSELESKQNATDNSLQTTDKTVVGAVNELKSGLTNLSEEVNGDATTYPYADVITIEDAVPSNLAECNVKIEPVQDLHGYSQPWVGGAGKNKLPMTLDGIKAANTDGTWNGNVYTINNMTFTVLVDSDNNVVGLSLNGTNNGNSYLVLDSNFDSTSHAGELVNGLDGQVKGLIFRVSSQADFVSVQDIINNNIAIEDNGSNKRFSLRAESWKTFSNALIYPMLRLATETDATFAPYTNICPISGHTEVDVQRDGKNLFDPINVETFDATGQGDMRYGHRYNSGTYTIVNNMASESIFVRQVKNDLSEYGQYSTINALNYATINVNDGYMLYVYYQSLTEEQRKNVCVNKGNDTTFVPYQGKTYTIALGSTIYGGTVDFDSGVMTVDRVSVDMGTLPWGADGQNMFRANISGAKTYSKNILPPWKCEVYPTKAQDDVNSPCISSTNWTSAVCLWNSGYSDAASVVTALSGKLLVYELATPFTVQLTPQQIQLLKGTNTLTASTGQISVTANGVSGSIGAVQEQVNGLAEKVDPIPIIRKGVVNFTDLAVDNVFSSDIAFDTPMPNADYTVTASASGTTVAVCNIGNRTVNGFTVYVRNIGTAAIGGAVMWQVIG